LSIGKVLRTCYSMSMSTQNKLMDIATELLSEKGYQGMKTQEVVDRGGVKKPTLYYHFRDKAHLLEAILEKRLSGFFQIWEAGYQGDIHIEIRDLTAKILLWAKENQIFLKGLLSLRWTPKDSEEGKIAAPYNARIQKCLLDWFTAGARDHGAFRGREGFLALTYWGLIQNLLEQVVLDLGQDIAIDLGGGQQMEFVWIPALKGWAGKYEVTNGEYRRFKSDHNSKEYKGHSLSGDRQPAVYVSWNNAQEFIRWMKSNCDLPQGFELTLPCKEEWLTVAQCGDGREYPWGNDWSRKRRSRIIG